MKSDKEIVEYTSMAHKLILAEKGEVTDKDMKQILWCRSEGYQIMDAVQIVLNSADNELRTK